MINLISGGVERVMGYILIFLQKKSAMSMQMREVSRLSALQISFS